MDGVILLFLATSWSGRTEYAYPVWSSHFTRKAFLCADVKSVETFLCNMFTENHIFDKYVCSNIVATVEYRRKNLMT
jgi:hypothetical protein